MSELPPDLDAPSLLDPRDWVAFREEAHKALDTALDFVQQRPEQPVWQPLPDSIKAVDAPLPAGAQPLASVVDTFSERVLPYSLGNTHPRFWGWVHGSGTPSALVSQMMMAALNANMGGRDHAPMYIERQLIQWMRELFDFPSHSSGLIVSGTSSATLLGLAVARHRKTDGRSREQGNADRALVAYTSCESHVSVSKALELMGLGSAALRSVPVGDDHAMDCLALKKMVTGDLERGLVPFAVVSTVGTVNTGAIDDLPTINTLCAEYALWHHVDGAFGALLALSENLKPRLRGIEQADSLAFDFHKWMHVGYSVGCLLVRDGDMHRQTFSAKPDYLQTEEAGIAGGAPWPTDYGVELSRGFMALAVWFQLQEMGTVKLGQAIERNCLQAAWLGAQVVLNPALELITPVQLNIVCFRYVNATLDTAAMDVLNKRIVVELHCRGIAAPSTTVLDGLSVIRVCITNHRTRQRDLQALVDAVVDIGHQLLA
ncbi:MAG: pyridoxal-dependent decarboxylase [Halioglobus sp.]